MRRSSIEFQLSLRQHVTRADYRGARNERIAPYFRWMQLSLANDAAPEPVSEDLAPGPSSVLQYRAEGRVLTNESAADYSDTTLLDMAAEDGPKKCLTINGVPFAIVRVH